MSARYTLLNHPSFMEPLSKEDLYLLEARGSIGRGEMVTDLLSQRSHTVGELIAGMRPPRTLDADARIARPAFREIRADEIADEVEDEEEFDDDEPEDGFTESGEKIHHHVHPSWLNYGKELFLVLLLAAATPLLYMVGSVYYIATSGAALFLLVTVWVVRASREFIVTDERVEHIWGLIGRSSQEVRICDIRSIDVREKGISGILGLGTVDFSSAANAGIEVSFQNVRKAHKIKVLVRGLQKSQSRD